jgi:hypothetical protein
MNMFGDDSDDSSGSGSGSDSDESSWSILTMMRCLYSC